MSREHCDNEHLLGVRVRQAISLQDVRPPLSKEGLLFGVGYKLLDLMGPMKGNETLNNFR